MLTALAGADSVSPASWLLAILPVATLLALVLWGRFGTPVNALLTVAVGAAVAWSAFAAGPATLVVGLGKGAWVGVWILYVIWPALLVHSLAGRIGMSALGESLEQVLPRRTENVLLLAWVLPSFLQGVSGFGTPIAICAPLLVAIGVDATRAVALPLVGYHWAVGFGSMGSSFYMGSLTANLSQDETQAFAGSLAVVLGVNVLLSGVLVALMAGGWRGLREGWRLLVTVGPVMALVQLGVVRLEPSIGALCAGSSGLLVVLCWRLAGSRRRRREPQAAVADGREDTQVPSAPPVRSDLPDTLSHRGTTPRNRAWASAVPYVVLAVLALAVFAPPALRSWVKGHALLGPDFPATRTGKGFSTEAVSTYNPIALLGHPGTLLLAACLVSLLIWRATAVWRPGTLRGVRGPWLKQSWKATPTTVLLASVAGVLVDSGMVRTVAVGAADAAGRAYPVVAPFVGALGSFITGSTTSSNALFSSLQHDVARLIGDRPADLLAAQTAGGNVGNSLAPVVIMLGVTAVGSSTSLSAVLRSTLWPALVLLVSVLTTTSVLVLLHR